MSYRDTLWSIQEAIQTARDNSPLAASDVTVMAASKMQSVEAITEAIDAGVNVFGENRVQEAESKWPGIKTAYPKVELHLIGPLQTNKVKAALELFDVIQTVDREKLVDELAKVGVAGKRFFVQVNIGKEEQKAGVMPDGVDALVEYARKAGLEVAGLMCVPPVEHPPAPYFALLREMAGRNELRELSMGMSDDYEVAVRMGASCVRLGRVLFGEDSRKG